MNIRPMTKDDIGKIIAIYGQELTFEKIGGIAEFENRFREILQEFPELCFVLEDRKDSSKIIGGVFGVIEGDVGLIPNIALLAEEHGKGYVAMLLERVIEEFKKREVKMVKMSEERWTTAPIGR